MRNENLLFCVSKTETARHAGGDIFLNKNYKIVRCFDINMYTLYFLHIYLHLFRECNITIENSKKVLLELILMKL